MEILGGGPDSDEAVRRERSGDDAEKRRRQVTASLDLGTTNLVPDGPAPSGPAFVSDPLVPAGTTPAGGDTPPAVSDPAIDAAEPVGAEAHARDYRPGLGETVLASASLAIAGLLVTFAGVTGGGPLLMLYARISMTPNEGPRIVAKGLTVIAVISAVLGFAALRRIRATTPRWVPHLAGGVILVAVFLALAAGYFWWSSTGDTMVVTDY
jgi:hypothetical protein